jgi:hypothetical protein
MAGIGAADGRSASRPYRYLVIDPSRLRRSAEGGHAAERRGPRGGRRGGRLQVLRVQPDTGAEDETFVVLRMVPTRGRTTASAAAGRYWISKDSSVTGVVEYRMFPENVRGVNCVPANATAPVLATSLNSVRSAVLQVVCGGAAPVPV